VVTDKEQVKLQILKDSINGMIDRHLTIRSNGSVRKNIIENSVKIAGREMFIEALIDFMTDKSLEEQMKLLESLKGETKDWEALDNKIGDLENQIEENKKFNQNTKYTNKIKTLLNTYGDDERFLSILENLVSKVEDVEEAKNMSEVAKQMKSNFKYLNFSKHQLSTISEKFARKAQDLTFKNHGLGRR
jgi:DNA repair ATPase RecN